MDRRNISTLSNNKGFKIVNMIKYLVLIFVFLFVGVLSSGNKVEGATENLSIKGYINSDSLERRLSEGLAGRNLPYVEFKVLSFPKDVSSYILKIEVCDSNNSNCEAKRTVCSKGLGGDNCVLETNSSGNPYSNYYFRLYYLTRGTFVLANCGTNQSSNSSCSSNSSFKIMYTISHDVEKNIFVVDLMSYDNNSSNDTKKYYDFSSLTNYVAELKLKREKVSDEATMEYVEFEEIFSVYDKKFSGSGDVYANVQKFEIELCSPYDLDDCVYKTILYDYVKIYNKDTTEFLYNQTIHDKLEGSIKYNSYFFRVYFKTEKLNEKLEGTGIYNFLELRHCGTDNYTGPTSNSCNEEEEFIQEEEAKRNVSLLDLTRKGYTVLKIIKTWDDSGAIFVNHLGVAGSQGFVRYYDISEVAPANVDIILNSEGYRSGNSIEKGTWVGTHVNADLKNGEITLGEDPEILYVKGNYLNVDFYSNLSNNNRIFYAFIDVEKSYKGEKCSYAGPERILCGATELKKKYIDNEEWYNEYTINFELYELEDDKSYYLLVCAYNQNFSDGIDCSNLKFHVDTKAPSVDEVPDIPDSNEDGWLNKKEFDGGIEIPVVESGSGIASCDYLLDGGSTKYSCKQNDGTTIIEKSDAIEGKSFSKITVILKDNVGNETTRIFEYRKMTIDTTLPIIDITGLDNDKNGWIKYNEGRIVVEERGSGVDTEEGCSYTIMVANSAVVSNKICSFDTITNGKYAFHVDAPIEQRDVTIKVTIIDKAGNSKTEVTDSINIDNVVPVVEYTYDNSVVKQEHNFVVYITETFTTGGSFSYCWVESKEEPCTPSLKPQIYSHGQAQNKKYANVVGSGHTGTYRFYFKMTDEAGNVCGSYLDGLFKFDNTAPTMKQLSIPDDNEDGYINKEEAIKGITVEIEESNKIVDCYYFLGGVTQEAGSCTTKDNKIIIKIPENIEKTMTDVFISLKDEAGNTNDGYEVVWVGKIVIDTEVPVVTNVNIPDSNDDGMINIEESKQGIKVEIEESNKIVDCYYFLGGTQEAGSCTTEDNKIIIKIPKNIEQTMTDVFISLKDEAGNINDGYEVVWEGKIVIDTKPIVIDDNSLKYKIIDNVGNEILGYGVDNQYKYIGVYGAEIKVKIVDDNLSSVDNYEEKESKYYKISAEAENNLPVETKDFTIKYQIIKDKEDWVLKISVFYSGEVLKAEVGIEFYETFITDAAGNPLKDSIFVDDLNIDTREPNLVVSSDKEDLVVAGETLNLKFGVNTPINYFIGNGNEVVTFSVCFEGGAECIEKVPANSGIEKVKDYPNIYEYFTYPVKIPKGANGKVTVKNITLGEGELLYNLAGYEIDLSGEYILDNVWVVTPIVTVDIEKVNGHSAYIEEISEKEFNYFAKIKDNEEISVIKDITATYEDEDGKVTNLLDYTTDLGNEIVFENGKNNEYKIKYNDIEIHTFTITTYYYDVEKISFKFTNGGKQNSGYTLIDDGSSVEISMQGVYGEEKQFYMEVVDNNANKPININYCENILLKDEESSKIDLTKEDCSSDGEGFIFSVKFNDSDFILLREADVSFYVQIDIKNLGVRLIEKNISIKNTSVIVIPIDKQGFYRVDNYSCEGLIGEEQLHFGSYDCSATLVGDLGSTKEIIIGVSSGEDDSRIDSVEVKTEGSDTYISYFVNESSGKSYYYEIIIESQDKETTPQISYNSGSYVCSNKESSLTNILHGQSFCIKFDVKDTMGYSLNIVEGSKTFGDDKKISWEDTESGDLQIDGSSTGDYKYKGTVEVEFTYDAGESSDELVIKNLMTILSSIVVKDIFGNEGKLSEEEIGKEINLIPEFKYLHKEISGKNIVITYTSVISEVEKATLKVGETDVGTCSVSEEELSCSITKDINNEEVALVATSITSEYVEVVGSVDQSIGKISMDVTDPTISFVAPENEVAYYKTSTFELTFSVGEAFTLVEGKSINFYVGDSSEKTCEIKKVEKKDYNFVVTVSGCEGTGDLYYEIDAGYIKDKSSNENESLKVGKTKATNINIDNRGYVETLTIESVTPDKNYITSYSTVTVTLDMNAKVEKVDRSLFDVTVGRISQVIIRDNDKVDIIIVSSSIEGKIILILMEGAITDVYGNESIRYLDLDTGVEVVNSKYRVDVGALLLDGEYTIVEGKVKHGNEEVGSYDSTNSIVTINGITYSIEASAVKYGEVAVGSYDSVSNKLLFGACVLRDDKYYCNEGDIIIFKGVANRNIKGSGVASLTYSIGNVSGTLTSALINNNEFIWVYKVAEGINGVITVSSIDLSSFTDEAGNGGNYSTDIPRVEIDTDAPSYNEEELYTTKVGESYIESEIIKYFGIDTSYDYSIEGLSSHVNNVTKKYNLAAEEVAITITVTDFASNSVTLARKVKIEARIINFEVEVKDEETMLTNYSFNKNVKVEVSNVNSEVVLNGYYISLEDKTSESTWSNTGTAEIELTEGSNTIYVCVKDDSESVSCSTNYITYLNISIDNNNSEDKYYNNLNMTVNGLTEGFNALINYELKNGEESVYSKEGVTTINDKLENINGEYKFVGEVCIKNNNEGYCKVIEIGSIKVDTELVLDSVSYEDKWTNSGIDVSVTIDNSEVSDISSIKVIDQYNKETEFACNSDSCFITDNGTYRIKVIDAAGNVAISDEIKIEMIDKESRTVRVSYTDGQEYKKEHTVKLIFGGEGAPITATKYVLVDLEKEVNVDNFYTVANVLNQAVSGDKITILSFTGEYKLYVYVEDKAGNKYVSGGTELWLDNTAPEITFNLGETSKYKQVSDITSGVVTVGDSHSGINSITYVYVDEYNNEYSELSVLEGKYKIKVIAIDKVGNSKEVTSDYLMIDNVGPSINRTNKDAKDSLPEYSVSDLGSGVKEVKYCYVVSGECEPDISVNLNEGKFSLNINTATTGHVTIIATDNADVSNKISDEFTYDNEAPTITYVVYNGDEYSEFEDDDYSEKDGVITFSKKTNKDILINLEFDDFSEICSYVLYTSASIKGKENANKCEQEGVEYKGIEKYDISRRNGKYLVSANLATKNTIYVTVYVKDAIGNDIFKEFVINNVNNKGIDFDLAIEGNYSRSDNIKISFANNDKDNVASVHYVSGETNGSFVKEKYESLLGTEAELVKENGEYPVVGVSENKTYVFKVIDIWGNVTYKYIDITNIDIKEPVLPGASLVVSEGKMFKDTGSGYEELSDLGNGIKVVYNGGLKLKIASFVDEGPASLYLRLCYEVGSYDASGNTVTIDGVEYTISGTEIKLGDNVVGAIVGSIITINDSKYVIEEETRVKDCSLKPLGDISKASSFELRKEYNGTISYSIVDAAGNSSGVASFNLIYMDSFTSNEGFNVTFDSGDDTTYSHFNVRYTVTDDTNRYEAIRLYIGKGNEKLCESDWLNNKEGTYSIPCAGVEVDDSYDIYYEVRDILGNVKDASVGSSIKLDNILPVNSSDKMSFTLGKNENNKYYLRYSINGDLGDVSTIKILYSDNSEYCTITYSSDVKLGECGELDALKEVNKTYVFKTKFIDEAGNESNSVEYSETYNDKRNIIIEEKYDPNPNMKNVTLVVHVNNAEGNVTKVLVKFVKGEQTLLSDKNLVDYAESVITKNKEYRLVVNSTNYSSLFSDGVISGKFVVEVHDSYTQAEGTKIDVKEVEINYDTRDISLAFSGEQTIISTINSGNSISFTSNKELEGSKYVLQRLSNNTLTSISTSTFDNVYENCNSLNYCVKGEVSSVENGYSLTIAKNDKLESAVYRLTVYAEDSLGHKVVNSGKYVYIDNTIPEINYSVTPVVNKDEIAVFDRSVTLTVYDRALGAVYYNSGIENIVIKKDDKDFYALPAEDKGENRVDVNLNEDGMYEITVIDKVGHSITKIVYIDSENEGINVFLGDKPLDIAILNEDSLKQFSFTLKEEMTKAKIELLVGTTVMYSVEISNNGIATVKKLNSTQTVESTVENTGYYLKSNDNIQVSSIFSSLSQFDLPSISSLSEKINKIRIAVEDVTGPSKRRSYEYSIDLVKPSISVNNGAKYNGVKIEKIDDLYSLTVNVMIDKSEDQLQEALKTIVATFIKSADGYVYSAIKDRLTITLGESSFVASENDWSKYSVLDKIGEYTLSFVYADMAGNESDKVSLELKVVDNVAPTIELNGRDITLHITTNDGVTYTDLGAKGYDTYGFDAEGKVKETTQYQLRITKDGGGVLCDVCYLENDYTFTSSATYKFEYSVKDSSSNMVSRTITIKVIDSKAPDITDTNRFAIVEEEGNRVFEIGEVKYTVVEDGGVILRVIGNDESVLDVNASTFMLNGFEYKIYDTYVILNGININDKIVCFGETDCEFKVLEAKDAQDGNATKIKAIKVEHSNDNKTYGTADYSLVENNENMFTLESIKFNKIGYYRITFATWDSIQNKTELQYVIRVFDIDNPEFDIKDENVENNVLTKEYDEDFISEIENLFGASYRDKIATWVENYVKNKNNVDYKDNYMIDSYVVGKVEQLDRDINNKEYAKYRVELTIKDTSGNESSITLTFVIEDTASPTSGNITFGYDASINDVIDFGEEEIIYTNKSEVYFILEGASDISDEYKYLYQIIENGFVRTTWAEYEGEAIRLSPSVTDENIQMQVQYKVVDGVLNSSSEVYSKVIEFDSYVPRLLINEVVGGEGLSNGAIYSDGGSIRVTFDNEEVSVRECFNNVCTNEMKLFEKDSGVEVNEFGHYKYIAIDKAGNETVLEFVILPKDNKFIEIDRRALSNVNSASEVEVEYDRVILQKLSENGNKFYFEDMGSIKDTDMVYFMGIVPDKAGAIFSIYSSGISGEIFKQYTSHFPINTSTQITDINPNYTIDDYIINHEGEKYIIIGIKHNASSPQDKPGSSEGEVDNDKKDDSSSGANLTWLLYVLGGIGVLGGGFLILRLKKRVRAA